MYIKDDDTELFKNADRIAIEAMQCDKNSVSHSKGGLIITSNLALVNNTYRMARLLDASGRIRINRMGSSMQMTTPIVEILSPDEDFPYNSATRKKEK